MSGYLNRVELIGRIGKKPVVSMTRDNQKMVKFSVATTKYWKDKSTDERKEKTEWHRIVVYNSKIAEIIEARNCTGVLVYLEGELKTNKWSDAQGVEQESTSINIGLGGRLMFLERRRDETSNTESQVEVEENTSDDDIPF